MNLLLVDDEQLVLDGLKNGIDWAANGFDKVYTAGDAEQAKVYLTQQNIDVMLCDIEMPGVSGLELLSWAETEKPDTVCIMLTCHAEFDYCLQTVKHHGFDYILKPAPNDEILASVNKAAELLKQRRDVKEREQAAGMLSRNRHAVDSALWTDYLTGELSLTDRRFQDLSAAAAPLDADTPMSFVLIRLMHTVRSKTLHLLRQQAAEMLEADGGWVVTADSMHLLFIQFSESELHRIDIKLRCTSFLKACRSLLNCNANCVVSGSVPLSELPQRYCAACTLAEQDLAHSGKILFLDRASERPAMPIDMDRDLWRVLLRDGRRDDFLREVRGTLKKRAENQAIGSSEMRAYTAGVMTTLFEFAGAQGDGRRGEDLSGALMHQIGLGSQISTMDEFDMWVETTADMIFHTVSISDKAQIVQQIKDYIQSHLGERILCEDIARNIYLNVDYMARLFKKETGMTIIDYITDARIGLAAKFVSETDLSISRIAQEVGYTSFSYFSKLFNRRMGMNPREYRRKYGR